jgi:AcrR family transcriptional regulator
MARALPMNPDERRAQILTAARRVFARQGYHQTGVSDIIHEAGVARGTFYNYFESKRVVFHAVIEDLMFEVMSVIRPIDVTAPIPEQVRGNLGRIIEAAMDRDVVRLLFAEAAGIDEEGNVLLRHFYDQVLLRIEGALETGMAIGWVRDGDARLGARCLLGMVKEPLFQAGLRGESVQVDALIDEMVRWMSGGLLK